MAKISLIRAYIEPEEQKDDPYALILEIDGVMAGKVEMAPRSWIYLDTNDDGDLIINNSISMEDNKWDHITREIIETAEIEDEQ
jgi:hypothetical protein